MRILIADTDLVCLGEMKQALEQAGHEVTMAGDGMSAWGHLTAAVPPDILVTRLDLGPKMPPGTALGRHAHSRQPCIPVIYIPTSVERSQHADPEHGEILVKPFAPATLVETIDRLLGKRTAAAGVSGDTGRAVQPHSARRSL